MTMLQEKLSNDHVTSKIIQSPHYKQNYPITMLQANLSNDHVTSKLIQ